ncbi:MAG: thioredoxin [Gemmatimonadaceae bacterium]|nr:thioredoxin [Gemmatimonadaceae bacterium]
MTTSQSATPEAARAAQHVTVRCQFCQTWNRVIAARASDRPKCGKCGRPLLLDRPVPLGDEEFARTIADSEIPVLVDFYADWCAPCKMMAPAVDELAGRYQGRALVAKVNTDLAQSTAAAFDIRGIPTTIVFRDGKEVARQTGAVPARALEELLQKAL